jgi:hypothetical protein
LTIFLLTVLTSICQTGIDYKALMKDIIRLDSCEAVADQLQKENLLLDSLVQERGQYIEFLTAQKIFQDSLLRSVMISLDRCLVLHEKEKVSGFRYLLKKLSDPWVAVPLMLLLHSTILHIK